MRYNKQLTSKYLFILFISAGTLLSSCEKDDEPETPAPSNNNTETTNENTALQFDGADGFCAAVISSTSYEVIPGTVVDIDFGTAVAAFTNDGFSSFVEAGSVNCEAQSLTKQGNNSYVHIYTYDPLNPSDLGIDFNNNASWDVVGDNGIPDFTYTTTVGFPSMGTVTGNAVLDRSQDYTVNISSVSGADSIIYQVGDVIEVVAGNVSNYTFTSDQLSNVPTGPSIVQVTPYIWEETNQSGKIIYFINERSKSKSITVQ